MEQKPLIPPPPIDDKPSMSAERRKQVIWMIWVPLILAILFILVVAVFVCLPEATTNIDTASMSNVSFLWVSAPAIPILLVIFAVFGALIYLMAKILGTLPGFFHKVQFYFDFGAKKIKELADKITAPVISMKSFQASAAHITKPSQKNTSQTKN